MHTHLKTFQVRAKLGEGGLLLNKRLDIKQGRVLCCSFNIPSYIVRCVGESGNLRQLLSAPLGISTRRLRRCI